MDPFATVSDDENEYRVLDLTHGFPPNSAIGKTIKWLKMYIPCLSGIHYGYFTILFSRAVFLILIICASLWIMSATVILAGMRAPTNVPDLPDLGFDLLPPLLEDDLFGNALLPVVGVSTIVRAIFHKHGLTMARRLVFLWTILVLGRCTTLVATSYPDASFSCRNYTSPTTLEDFLIETVYRKHFLTCGDLMYSGHAVYFTLMGLSWSYYSVYMLEKLVWIPISFCLLILISTRVHYTTDVMVAFYLTMLSWYLYHLVATEPTIRKKSRLIYWLEKDIIMWEDNHAHPDVEAGKIAAYPMA